MTWFGAPRDSMRLLDPFLTSYGQRKIYFFLPKDSARGQRCQSVAVTWETTGMWRVSVRATV